MGIGVWRMPREFRQNIIPKLENAVAIEQRLNDILQTQETRINLLSEIQQRQTKVG
jgi:predicted component of type VI protein secretion system